MSHKRNVAILGRSWLAYTAIAIACVINVVPASFAQDPQIVVQGTSATAGNEPEEPQTYEDMSEDLRTKTWEHMGAYVAEPIGRFKVGPQFVEGETVYVLRAPVGPRMASVEVSTTPFMSELTRAYEPSGRPDEQPAGW